MTNPLKKAYREVKTDIKNLPFIDKAQKTALINDEKEFYEDLKGICGITMGDKVIAFNAPRTTGSN